MYVIGEVMMAVVSVVILSEMDIHLIQPKLNVMPVLIVIGQLQMLLKVWELAQNVPQEKHLMPIKQLANKSLSFCLPNNSGRQNKEFIYLSKIKFIKCCLNLSDNLSFKNPY